MCYYKSQSLCSHYECLLFIIMVMHPSIPQGHTASVKPFPLIGLLPENNMGQYYRYHGSLTTPPCSPVVVWSVYEVPISLSYSQVCQIH